MSRSEHIARSITKTYRKSIWTPFLTAVKRYELISENDSIAVCISGGKDSMLLALLIKMLQAHSDFPFEVKYLVMDPGYKPENLEEIKKNAELLDIPINIFSTNIFNVTYKQEKSPCYLCAKMRRGYLYKFAKELDCNKIALGHHFNDVIETVVMGMFYSSILSTMPPKLHSKNFEGMQLIRPIYCVREQDIIRWKNYNSLEFLQCACRFTEQSELNEELSKRKEIKNLIKSLKKTNPNIEKSIFNSIHSVNIDTFPMYKSDDVYYSFLEKFNKEKD